MRPAPPHPPLGTSTWNAAESSFAEIRALVERRQAEVIQSIKRISEEKRRALEDQLALIESERSLVRGQCDSLNDLVRFNCLLPS
ncbi:unnamed protein product [Mesocestoides corti]|uniref:Tektin n=1 Tax=Mesocestoides corti TaxID=53468 RepID=A0A0R3U1P0_MESCO|nr:unnamed protein product [Mesocestoides corti]